MKQIILASESPRRKEILKKTGLKFKVVKSNFKEYADLRLNPHELTKKLSFEKAKTVHKKHKNSIVIAADTIVAYSGKILGKPKGKKDAKKMLKFLSGNVHSIITGFTIIDGSNIIMKSEETKVYMRKVNDEEINAYIRTNEPLGKAGAYAIQGIAKKFIEKIDGDLFNAIGLPLNSLVRELKKLGIKVI